MDLGTHVLEVETKYDVPPDAAVPGLGGLPHVDRVAEPAAVDLDAAYFDTAGLDLLGLGITLRRRRGGDDAGWHLKLPDEVGRHELREPLTPDGAVPRSFRAILAGVLRGARLREVGTIATHREVTALLDPSGQVLAELCDDHVTAVRRLLRGASAARDVVWREWELELLGADDELATAAAARLVEAGASPAAYPSKLARTLGSEAVTGSRGARTGRMGRRASAREVLAPYLAGQVRRLRQLDPLVRADLPDAVHQMRVTCRRLRAVLACFRREFDTAQARHVRDELGWVVDVLGGERDLEVLRERIGTLVRAHDVTTARAESWVDERLSLNLGDARAAARAALRSPRYAALLAALADPDWPEWSARADLRSGPELTRGLRREVTRLADAAAAAEHCHGRAHDEALHTVRKAAKRLRYAAEAVRPRFGPRAVELGERMSELQDVLGLHHDEVVAGSTVRLLRRERSTSGRPAAADRILRDLADSRNAEVRAYRRAWHRLADSGVLTWLG